MRWGPPSIQQPIIERGFHLICLFCESGGGHIDLIKRSKRETMSAEWENVEQNLLKHTSVVNNDRVGR
jgi:hypothetical protein